MSKRVVNIISQGSRSYKCMELEFLSPHVCVTRPYIKQNGTVRFTFTDFYGVRNFPFLRSNKTSTFFHIARTVNFTFHFRNYVKETVAVICWVSRIAVACVLRQQLAIALSSILIWYPAILSPSFMSLWFQILFKPNLWRLAGADKPSCFTWHLPCWSFWNLPVVRRLRSTERAFIGWFITCTSDLYWNTWRSGFLDPLPSLSACSVACERFLFESLSKVFLDLCHYTQMVVGKMLYWLKSLHFILKFIHNSSINFL